MPTTAFTSAYDSLCHHVSQTALLTSIENVLCWDERTQMPPEAGPYRAVQRSFLAGEIHRRRTDPRLGEWLAILADSPLATDPYSDAGATIRWIQRGYEKQKKLPQSLVEELAETASQAEQVWSEAHKANSFATFQPLLERMIELKKQQAAAYGYNKTPYDPLLDDFEPDATADDIQIILTDLAEELVPLVRAIDRSARQPDINILWQPCSIGAQDVFNRSIAEAIGYSFAAGRLDTTHHPFTVTLGPQDTRITTRYDEHFMPSALFSTLHEVGHALYEQGLPDEHFGLPLGEFVSLGIHESQSRLWENLVGRSRPFWEYLFPAAQDAFPDALGNETLDSFYFAINSVQPSFIRVEADEVTYNLHILIRFELEQAMLTGDLVVADLPGAWNEKYAAYLGIEPPNDSDGCLQDVHWAAGLIGYFPTYALGNLYAAQFYAQAQADLKDLGSLLSRGEFAPLLEWLRSNIYQHGQRYTASELVLRATGRPLSHEALLTSLRTKLGPLYSV
ncbi:MAG: carboxypeptidase M32 [Pirellulales bacterium]|nr:carboxypeptidase M32 [Pirellulales bacterium]